MSDDLIRRSDAIKAFCMDCKGQGEPCEHSDTCKTMRVLRSRKKIPTIEPKRGEWKKVKNVHAWDVSGVETWGVKRKCTNCDFRHTFIEDHGHYNFCPNCGADMRKESE